MFYIDITTVYGLPTQKMHSCSPLGLMLVKYNFGHILEQLSLLAKLYPGKHWVHFSIFPTT